MVETCNIITHLKVAWHDTHLHWKFASPSPSPKTTNKDNNRDNKKKSNQRLQTSPHNHIIKNRVAGLTFTFYMMTDGTADWKSMSKNVTAGTTSPWQTGQEAEYTQDEKLASGLNIHDCKRDSEIKRWKDSRREKDHQRASGERVRDPKFQLHRQDIEDTNDPKFLD